MRRNISRKDYNDRKNVSATSASVEGMVKCVEGMVKCVEGMVKWQSLAATA